MRRLPHPRRPRPTRPRRWTLRTRLIATLALLLAAVCLVVATATALQLRGFLVGRLDAQLVAAGTRTADAGQPGHSGTPEQTGVGFLLSPGQAAGTLGARIAGGQVTVAVLDERGTTRTVTGGDAEAVAEVPVDGRAHTADVGREGEYRLVATRSTDGDVLVTGLSLNEVNRTVGRLVAVEVAVSLVALLLAAAAASVVVRRSLRPLVRVAATAGRVVTLPLDRGEVVLADRVEAADTDPRTEVGQVGAALNELLDRVTAALTARQASETRVRQFVADASHELRTPLASIRGYAELTRRQRAEAAPELRHAMERVEAESTRMTSLVEDLLLLARLDTGRALEAVPVDLTRLVLDAVGDARAAGRDHRWRMDLPTEPVLVTGDGHALHQVLANLLGNARTHTPGATTVTTAVRPAADGAVALTVTDDGPGIPADVLPTVFERFARASTARTPGAGSTGLGLAIVHAIVTAHGGTSEVTSRPGCTTFTVHLPAVTDG